MPWIQATLRGQKVLARAKPDGSFAVEGGRVEVRYKPNDGRAYRASSQNLERVAGAPLLGDDACGPASAGDSAGRPGKRAVPETLEAAPKDAWIVYADGACSGNPGPAGSGVVIVSPDGKTYEGFEWLGQATNNIAELTAILRALEWIPAGASPILVHTDSQYSIGVLQKGWKAKVNQELVAAAKKVVADRRARLVYVPGHSGVPLNERADELARQAATTGRTLVPRVEV
jgi:ribonuclease HI